MSALFPLKHTPNVILLPKGEPNELQETIS
jgi:hypothetical protein